MVYKLQVHTRNTVFSADSNVLLFRTAEGSVVAVFASDAGRSTLCHVHTLCVCVCVCVWVDTMVHQWFDSGTKYIGSLEYVLCYHGHTQESGVILSNTQPL